MPLKRLAVGIAAAFLFSTLGLATSAQAIKRFSVVGGGAQSHIGNGLAIPIQQAAINSVVTGQAAAAAREGSWARRHGVRSSRS
jgi:hypothetical protein